MPRNRGRPPKDPGLVARALRLVDEGKTPAEAAAVIGVGQSTVYGWIADRRRRDPPTSPSPSSEPSIRPKRSPVANPISPAAGPPDDDDELGDLAGIHAAPDDISAIDALIAIVERKLRTASDARTGPLAATLASLIVKRAKLRPPPAPSPEELEREARPLADEVLEQIGSAVRAAELELGLP